MLSIVNRCVAAGGGTQVDRYGANIFGLLSTYVSLLFKSATRDSLRLHVLELVAVVLFIVSTISYSKFVINQLQNWQHDPEIYPQSLNNEVYNAIDSIFQIIYGKKNK